MHLISGARQGNRAAQAEIAAWPLLPWWWEYLWGWFSEIRQRIPAGMGIGPATWPDFHAWATLTHRHPTPDEWSLLAAMDSIFVEVMNAEDESHHQHGRAHQGPRP